MSQAFHPSSISGLDGFLFDVSSPIGAPHLFGPFEAQRSPRSARPVRCTSSGPWSPTGALAVHGDHESGTAGSTGGSIASIPSFHSFFHESHRETLVPCAQQDMTGTTVGKVIGSVDGKEGMPSMDEIFAGLLDGSNGAVVSTRGESEHFLRDEVLLFDSATSRCHAASRGPASKAAGISELSVSVSEQPQQQQQQEEILFLSDSSDGHPSPSLLTMDRINSMNFENTFSVGSENGDEDEDELLLSRSKRARRDHDDISSDHSRVGIQKRRVPPEQLRIKVPPATGQKAQRVRPIDPATGCISRGKIAVTVKNEKEQQQQPARERTPESSRLWKVSFVAPQYKDRLHIDITSKTRCEKPMDSVPDTLYSSLKYEVRQRVTGPICSGQQFLLGKITAIDEATGQEVLKDGQSILKGIVEGALTRPVKDVSNATPGAACGDEPGSTFEGVLRCQFGSVSFHHNRARFRWQISYFTPNDLENPVAQCVSAPFLVLARKASTGKRKARSQTSNSKIREVTGTKEPSGRVSATLQGFSSMLEDLLHIMRNLPDKERAKALSMIQERVPYP